jgi:hypothetical protein
MFLQRPDFHSLVRARSVGAALLCAALLLTACGGGDKKATPTPTKSAATVAAPTTGTGSSNKATPGTHATNASGSTTGNTSSAQPTTDFASLESTANAQLTALASFKGSLDACKLVSRKDAESIIGQKLSGDPFHGTTGIENATFICNYNPESVPGTAVVDGKTVMLVALTKDDLKTLGLPESDLTKVFADDREKAKTQAGFTNVDGLGDEAFYTNASGLSVRKGDKGIAVSGLPLDKAKEFAKKALGNL